MDKKVVHTRKRYLALAAVFILLGLGLVFLPDKDNKKEMKPEHMLSKLIDNSRFLSTDQVAEKLVGNDPSMLLIDIRDKEEFEKGSLPGAMNIPFDQILAEDAVKLFSRKAYDKVIFGNSDIIADQAWILLSRELNTRTYIMKGGLNAWVEDILKPVKPHEGAPIEYFEQYDFRKAAGRYFAGQNQAYEYLDVDVKSTVNKNTVSKPKPASRPVLPPPAEEEEDEDEGC